MTSQQTIQLIRQALIARNFMSDSVEDYQVQEHYATYIKRYHADHSPNIPAEIEHIPEGKLKEEALRILNGESVNTPVKAASLEDAIIANAGSSNETQTVNTAETVQDAGVTSEPKNDGDVAETAESPEPEQSPEPEPEQSPEPEPEQSPEPEPEQSLEPEPEPEPEQSPEQLVEHQETAPEAIDVDLPETLEFLDGEDLEIDIRLGQEFKYASGAEVIDGTDVTVEINSFDLNVDITQTETGHFVVSGLTAEHDGTTLVARIDIGGLTETHNFTLELVD